MENIKKVWAKMKEHKKASIIGAAVIVVLLIVIAVNNSSSNGFYTIDVAQNYKLECSGDNGYAEPYASITTGEDQDNLIKDILFKLYPNSSNDYIKWDKYQKFIDNINFTYNKKDHISNGDEITATANYDKNQAKELKLKLKDTTLKTKAADLSSYVNNDTNISETLQKNIDQKATEAISQWFANENEHDHLIQLWSNIGGGTTFGFGDISSNNISLVNGPEISSKYKLSYKDDPSSSRCKFVYIFQFELAGPTEINIWGEATQRGQLTGYATIAVVDVQIENDNILDYIIHDLDGNILDPTTKEALLPLITFKNLDEAKQKVSDAKISKNYDIIAL